jgi:hypothetical protein
MACEAKLAFMIDRAGEGWNRKSAFALRASAFAKADKTVDSLRASVSPLACQP